MTSDLPPAAVDGVYTPAIKPSIGVQLFIEYGFAFLIAASIAYTCWFFYKNLYLPQPFFYEPSGTFMDWYSLVYYAKHPGAYNIAGTIYPPLSFIILNIFSDGRCYQSTTGELNRACDPWGIVVMSAIFVINVFFTFLSFRKADKKTWIPRSFAISFGLPMIFGYERGNFVLFTYTCVLLGFGPLLKSARLRWFFAGASINFKVYLVGAALAPLLHRRWMQTEGIIVATFLIYMGTWAIFGEGSPEQIIGNVTSYGSNFGAAQLLDIWYPSSFIPAISLLRGMLFPIYTILDSQISDLLLAACIFLQRSAQVMIAGAAVAIWLRPESVPRHRAVFFAIAMALATAEAGGYTHVILLLFVFMERWKGIAVSAAIVMAYMLCVPVEWVVSPVAPLVRWSYLADTDVIVQYGFGIFAFLRPILGIFIIWLLSFVTMRDVWRDIRSQGWSGRWRYRDDAPILPRVVPPSRDFS